MPSLFRATIGLKQRQWTWHRANSGQLSRIAQEAVDRRMAIEALPESAVDRAAECAAQAFWDFYELGGQYAIENERIIRHEATDEQIAADARRLGVPADQLLDLLDELYDIEREAFLQREIAIAMVRR
jgi:hypothetical protein